MIYSNEYCNDAGIKALEIVQALGVDFYRENEYDAHYLGKKYTYEDLTIKFYNNNKENRLYIYIGNTQMVDWNLVTEDAEYNDKVDWPALINEIYRKVPYIIIQREFEKVDRKNKEDQLNELAPYFKNCIELYNIDKSLRILNNILKRNNLSIVREKTYWKPSDSGIIAEYDDYSEDYSGMFTVYHNGSPVAEFKGNEFNLFPGMYYYVEHFNPGNWIGIFKTAVNEATKVGNRLTNQRTNNNINNMIRKLKR